MNISSLLVWLAIYLLWLCGVWHCWEGLYNYSRRTIPLPINFPFSHSAMAGVMLPRRWAVSSVLSSKSPSLPPPLESTLPSDPCPLLLWLSWLSTPEQGEAAVTLFSEFSFMTKPQELITAQGNEQSAGTHREWTEGELLGKAEWNQMMMMMMAFCWVLIFHYYRYNKRLLVSEEKQALAVSISHQQQEQSKPCSGLSKFSWNWQHHQCNTQNVRWEPVELRGDCREGSRPLGLWFLQKQPGLCQQQDSNHFPQETPVQYSSPARHPWIAYFGQEALSTTAPNLPLVLQSSSKKKKKNIEENINPQIVRKLVKLNWSKQCTECSKSLQGF